MRSYTMVRECVCDGRCAADSDRSQRADAHVCAQPNLQPEGARHGSLPSDHHRRLPVPAPQAYLLHGAPTHPNQHFFVTRLIYSTCLR